jgi:hypothetical protein
VKVCITWTCALTWTGTERVLRESSVVSGVVVEAARSSVGVAVGRTEGVAFTVHGEGGFVCGAATGCWGC